MYTLHALRSKVVWSLLGFTAALSACSGPVGPEGAQGLPGLNGEAGPPGMPWPALDGGADRSDADSLSETAAPLEGGAPGDAQPENDGGAGADASAANVGCMAPCHGFGGIVEQWKTSRHYSAYVSNLGGTEVATWTGAQACGNCHAVDGIQLRVAGAVTTVDGGAIAHFANGELNYASGPSGAATEPRYAGSAQVAEVGCVTCHSVTNASDPHVTGSDYTKGTFPQRVPSGAGDVAYLEKSPDKAAVVGTAIVPMGGSNTCAWCHKSRKDVTSYIGASNAISNAFWGPHEGPQTDVFSGRGGYHYAGLTYGTSTHQKKLACVDCHMPSVSTNGGYPDHSFAPRLSACQSCHAGATSFDVLSGQSAVKAAMTELQGALNGAGLLTRSAAAPYAALSGSQLTDAQFNLDTSRPGGGADGGNVVLTSDQAGALYNYFLVARGGALGVHNPAYVRQLVFDSYVAIAGHAPSTLVRPQ